MRWRARLAIGGIVVTCAAAACGDDQLGAAPPTGSGDGDGDTDTDGDVPLPPCVQLGGGDTDGGGSGDGDGDDFGFKFDVGHDGELGFPADCDEVEDTKTNLGCEFWAVDLPNEWRGTPQSPGAENQQFAVVVANGSSDASVDVQVFVGTSDMPVAEAGVEADATHTFALDPLNISPQMNTVDGQAYRIESTRPITAYQFNPLDNQIEVYSNDASLLLPSHALGTDYSAVTGNGVWLSTMPDDPMPAPAGAFISVVAVEDATTVSIFPTGDLLPGETEDVMLDRGDVFTVLSDVGEQLTNLSGSRVTADKPVATFSGNVATVVPIAKGACCADHLEHQLLPYDAWGSAYEAVPPPSPENEGNDAAVYRITAAFDGTGLIYCPARPEGAPAVLQADETVSFETAWPFTVRTSDPDESISLAQFLESNAALNDQGQIGDPALLVLPPTEQLQRKILFAVPEGYARNWVTITGPPGEWSLDGEVIAEDEKRELATLSRRMRYFAQVEIEAGQHLVEADVPVGVTVLGLDTAVSYGFPGGVGLRVIKPVPPAG